MPSTEDTKYIGQYGHFSKSLLSLTSTFTCSVLQQQNPLTLAKSLIIIMSHSLRAEHSKTQFL